MFLDDVDYLAEISNACFASCALFTVHSLYASYRLIEERGHDRIQGAESSSGVGRHRGGRARRGATRVFRSPP